jgi:hypothetical protein
MPAYRLLRIVPSQPLSRFAAVTLLLALAASDASAQLGKLRKIGADAAKSAVKEKITGKDTTATAKPGAAPASATTGNAATGNAARPAAVTAATAAVDATLTAERVDLVLVALAPLVAAAEAETRNRIIEREYLKKDSLAKECFKSGAGRMPPAQSAATQKQVAALTKDSERLQERNNTALLAGSADGPFLQDSLGVAMMRSVTLAMGMKCQIDYAPTSLLKKRGAEVRVSGDVEPVKVTINEAARGKLSQAQFARIRERIALYGIGLSNPGAKMGVEGVFTSEERAVLAARSAKITGMTPFFRNGTLAWGGGGDLMGW